MNKRIVAGNRTRRSIHDGTLALMSRTRLTLRNLPARLHIVHVGN